MYREDGQVLDPAVRAEIVTSEVTRAHETGNHGTIYSSPAVLLAVFLSIALIQSTLAREWPHIPHTFGYSVGMLNCHVGILVSFNFLESRGWFISGTFLLLLFVQ